MALPKRFEQPSNFAWGTFKDKGGHTIRYGVAKPAGEPKGTVVLTTGFRETTEKYFEVMNDLTERGYAVWAMDWRGQGGSERFFPEHPQRMYSEDYSTHIETLHHFATQVVKKEGASLTMLTHSMGGNIGLRYLHDHPETFDSAVMTAPMCDIFTPGFPRSVVNALLKGAELGNIMGDYVPTAKDWDPAKHVFEGNKLSSDPARFAVIEEIYKQKPELMMGEATYGWVKQALASIATLHAEAYLKEIKTPILMAIAGNDHVVSSTASQRAAGLLPNCIRVDVTDSKHEVWMERDTIRAPWMERVTAFLNERPGPQPKSDQNNVPRPPKLG